MSILIEGSSCITNTTYHPSLPLSSFLLSLPLPLSPSPSPSPSSSPSLSLSPSLQVVHPAGAITQFLQFFGAHIFILWKLALLKKRVLIYSPPPIGLVCYRGRPHPRRPHPLPLTDIYIYSLPPPLPYSLSLPFPSLPLPLPPPLLPLFLPSPSLLSLSVLHMSPNRTCTERKPGYRL